MLKKYIVVMTAITIAALLGGLIFAQYIMRSRGRIIGVNVEVYADTGLTTRLTEIDWGMLPPGAARNVTGYVLNAGNAAVSVSCYTQDWTPPAAATYIGLNAYFDDAWLLPGESSPLTFELVIDANITDIDTFEFYIIVVGTYVEGWRGPYF